MSVRAGRDLETEDKSGYPYCDMVMPDERFISDRGSVQMATVWPVHSQSRVSRIPLYESSRNESELSTQGVNDSTSASRHHHVHEHHHHVWHHFSHGGFGSGGDFGWQDWPPQPWQSHQRWRGRQHGPWAPAWVFEQLAPWGGGAGKWSLLGGVLLLLGMVLCRGAVHFVRVHRPRPPALE